MYPQIFVLYSLFNETDPNLSVIYSILIQPGVEDFIHISDLSSVILSFISRKEKIPTEIIQIIQNRLYILLRDNFESENTRKIKAAINEEAGYIYETYTYNTNQYPNIISSKKEDSDSSKFLPSIPTTPLQDEWGLYEFTPDFSSPFIWRIKFIYLFNHTYNDGNAMPARADAISQLISNMLSVPVSSLELNPKTGVREIYAQTEKTPDAVNTFEFLLDIGPFFRAIFNGYRNTLVKASEMNIPNNPQPIVSDITATIDNDNNIICNVELFSFFMKPSISEVHTLRLQNFIDTLTEDYNNLLNKSKNKKNFISYEQFIFDHKNEEIIQIYDYSLTIPVSKKNDPAFRNLLKYFSGKNNGKTGNNERSVKDKNNKEIEIVADYETTFGIQMKKLLHNFFRNISAPNINEIFNEIISLLESFVMTNFFIENAIQQLIYNGKVFVIQNSIRPYLSRQYKVEQFTSRDINNLYFNCGGIIIDKDLKDSITQDQENKKNYFNQPDTHLTSFQDVRQLFPSPLFFDAEKSVGFGVNKRKEILQLVQYRTFPLYNNFQFEPTNKDLLFLQTNFIPSLPDNSLYPSGNFQPLPSSKVDIYFVQFRSNELLSNRQDKLLPQKMSHYLVKGDAIFPEEFLTNLNNLNQHYKLTQIDATTYLLSFLQPKSEQVSIVQYLKLFGYDATELSDGFTQVDLIELPIQTYFIHIDIPSDDYFILDSIYLLEIEMLSFLNTFPGSSNDLSNDLSWIDQLKDLITPEKQIIFVTSDVISLIRSIVPEKLFSFVMSVLNKKLRGFYDYRYTLDVASQIQTSLQKIFDSTISQIIHLLKKFNGKKLYPNNLEISLLPRYTQKIISILKREIIVKTIVEEITKESVTNELVTKEIDIKETIIGEPSVGESEKYLNEFSNNFINEIIQNLSIYLGKPMDTEFIVYISNKLNLDKDIVANIVSTIISSFEEPSSYQIQISQRLSNLPTSTYEIVQLSKYEYILATSEPDISFDQLYLTDSYFPITITPFNSVDSSVASRKEIITTINDNEYRSFYSNLYDRFLLSIYTPMDTLIMKDKLNYVFSLFDHGIFQYQLTELDGSTGSAGLTKSTGSTGSSEPIPIFNYDFIIFSNNIILDDHDEKGLLQQFIFYLPKRKDNGTLFRYFNGNFVHQDIIGSRGFTIEAFSELSKVTVTMSKSLIKELVKETATDLGIDTKKDTTRIFEFISDLIISSLIKLNQLLPKTTFLFIEGKSVDDDYEFSFFISSFNIIGPSRKIDPIDIMSKTLQYNVSSLFVDTIDSKYLIDAIREKRKDLRTTDEIIYSLYPQNNHQVESKKDKLLVNNSNSISVLNCGSILDQERLFNVRQSSYILSTIPMLNSGEYERTNDEQLNFELASRQNEIDKTNESYRKDVKNSKTALSITNKLWFSDTVSDLYFKSNQTPRWSEWSSDGKYLALGFDSGIQMLGLINNSFIVLGNFDHYGATKIIFGNNGFFISIQDGETSDNLRPYAILWNVMTNKQISIFNFVDIRIGDKVYGFTNLSSSASVENNIKVVTEIKNGKYFSNRQEINSIVPVKDFNNFLFSPSSLYIACNGTIKQYSQDNKFNIYSCNGQLVYSSTNIMQDFSWSSQNYLVSITQHKPEQSIYNLSIYNPTFLNESSKNNQVIKPTVISATINYLTKLPIYDTSLILLNSEKSINTSNIIKEAVSRRKGFWIFNLFLVREDDGLTVYDFSTLTHTAFNLEVINLSNLQLERINDHVLTLFYRDIQIYPFQSQFTEPFNPIGPLEVFPIINQSIYYKWIDNHLFTWYYRLYFEENKEIEETIITVTTKNDDNLLEITISISGYYAVIPNYPNESGEILITILNENNVADIPLNQIYYNPEFRYTKPVDVVSSVLNVSLMYENTYDEYQDYNDNEKYPISSKLSNFDPEMSKYDLSVWIFDSNNYSQLTNNKNAKIYNQGNLSIIVDSEANTIYIVPRKIIRRDESKFENVILDQKVKYEKIIDEINIIQEDIKYISDKSFQTDDDIDRLSILTDVLITKNDIRHDYLVNIETWIRQINKEIEKINISYGNIFSDKKADVKFLKLERKQISQEKNNMLAEKKKILTILNDPNLVEDEFKETEQKFQLYLSDQQLRLESLNISIAEKDKRDADIVQEIKDLNFEIKHQFVPSSTEKEIDNLLNLQKQISKQRNTVYKLLNTQPFDFTNRQLIIQYDSDLESIKSQLEELNIQLRNETVLQNKEVSTKLGLERFEQIQKIINKEISLEYLEKRSSLGYINETTSTLLIPYYEKDILKHHTSNYNEKDMIETTINLLKEEILNETKLLSSDEQRLKDLFDQKRYLENNNQTLDQALDQINEKIDSLTSVILNKEKETEDEEEYLETLIEQRGYLENLQRTFLDMYPENDFYDVEEKDYQDYQDYLIQSGNYQIDHPVSVKVIKLEFPLLDDKIIFDNSIKSSMDENTILNFILNSKPSWSDNTAQLFNSLDPQYENESAFIEKYINKSYSFKSSFDLMKVINKKEESTLLFESTLPEVIPLPGIGVIGKNETGSLSPAIKYIPIFYTTKGITTNIIPHVQYRKPLFITNKEVDSPIYIANIKLLNGLSNEDILSINNQFYMVEWSNINKSSDEGISYLDRKIGILMIHFLNVKGKVITILPSNGICDEVPFQGYRDTRYAAFDTVEIEYVNNQYNVKIKFLHSDGTNANYHIFPFTDLIDPKNIGTKNEPREFGRNKASAPFIYNTLINETDIKNWIISDLTLIWRPDGEYFCVWYTFDNNQPAYYGTSISIYSKDGVLVFEKKLLMFRTFSILFDITDYKILVGGYGQGFPGLEVRFGRLKFYDPATKKDLNGKELTNWSSRQNINCFDSETSSLPIKIKSLKFFKMVLGVYYFSIYTDQSNNSYLRIEGYEQDKTIKLSSNPIDISLSAGTGYASIIYEDKTEIWNIFGHCIDVIRGQAKWQE